MASKLVNGRYRDCILPAVGCRLDDVPAALRGPRRNLMQDRTPLLCVPLPGCAPWARSWRQAPSSPAAVGSPVATPTAAVDAAAVGGTPGSGSRAKGKRGREDKPEDAGMGDDTPLGPFAAAASASSPLVGGHHRGSAGGGGSSGMPTLPSFTLPSFAAAGAVEGSPAAGTAWPPRMPGASPPAPPASQPAAGGSGSGSGGADAIMGGDEPDVAPRPTAARRVGDAPPLPFGLPVGAATAAGGSSVGPTVGPGEGADAAFRPCVPVPDDPGFACTVHVRTVL